MKSVVRDAAILMGLALAAATLSAFFHPKRPAWYLVVSDEVLRWSIDLDRARELMAEGKVLWVDARPGKKFKDEHFPGAISLDAEHWSDLVIEQLPVLQNAMGGPVIVYCDGTRCEKSNEVAKHLRESLGLDTVYLLKGNWRKLAKTLQ